MAGFFKTIKRVMTGRVLHQIDTPVMAGRCTMSLRLKEETGTQERYIVLAGLASGNSQYYAFELDEFDRFLEAAKEICSAAHGTASR